MKKVKENKDDIGYTASIILVLIIASGIQLVPDIIIRIFKISGEANLLLKIITSNISLIVGAIIVWMKFKGRKIKDMGLTKISMAKKDFVVGLGMGAITITSVVAILILLGQLKLVSNDVNFSMSLINGMITFIFVGVGEEVFCRGFCCSLLRTTGNKYYTIIIPSLIFTLLHSSNTGINIIAYLNLFLFGVLSSIMYMKSKSLWMSIGFHITWNYFQGYIWGREVSGINVNSMFNTKDIGKSLLTGGAFGPEGGIIVTVILLLSFIFILYYYRNSKLDDFIEVNDNTVTV